MLFSQDQLETLYQCLQDKDALTEYSQYNNWGYAVSDDQFSGSSNEVVGGATAPEMTDAQLKEYTLEQTKGMCTTWLNRVHVLALKKKRKLNKSTKEFITNHRNQALDMVIARDEKLRMQSQDRTIRNLKDSQGLYNQ